MLRKRCREGINLQHEPVGLLPYQQILKTPGRCEAVGLNIAA
jgi:hypothetical protein